MYYTAFHKTWIVQITGKSTLTVKYVCNNVGRQQVAKNCEKKVFYAHLEPNQSSDVTTVLKVQARIPKIRRTYKNKETQLKKKTA